MELSDKLKKFDSFSFTNNNVEYINRLFKLGLSSNGKRKITVERFEESLNAVELKLKNLEFNSMENLSIKKEKEALSSKLIKLVPSFEKKGKILDMQDIDFIDIVPDDYDETDFVFEIEK